MVEHGIARHNNTEILVFSTGAAISVNRDTDMMLESIYGYVCID